MRQSVVLAACLVGSLVLAAGCLVGREDEESSPGGLLEGLASAAITSELGEDLVLMPFLQNGTVGISYFLLNAVHYNGTWKQTAQARDLNWSAEGLRAGPLSVEGTSNPMDSSGVEASVAGPGNHVFLLTLNVVSGAPVVYYRGWSVDLGIEALTGVAMEEFDLHQTELLPSLP